VPPNPALVKLAMSVHRALYGLSGGRIGGRIRGAGVVLLTTKGRKSGRPHTTPLFYLPDGGRYVIVASYGGHPKHPAWYLNLREEPDAEATIDGKRMRVHARTANAQERAALWPRLVAMYGEYETYQQHTSRTIPVVILERTG
jgi:deazaflavin-dependent oxidoreductase (nitroreductase family)